MGAGSKLCCLEISRNRSVTGVLAAGVSVGWGHYYIITQNQWRDANVECHRSVAVCADGAGCVCEFALVSSNYY